MVFPLKECFLPMTNNHCLWYNDCLDKVYNCGSQGFPKGQASVTCWSMFYTSSFGMNSMKCHETLLLPYMLGLKFPNYH